MESLWKSSPLGFVPHATRRSGAPIFETISLVDAAPARPEARRSIFKRLFAVL
jgi:DNA polymerase IIIc chi subunit